MVMDVAVRAVEIEVGRTVGLLTCSALPRQVPRSQLRFLTPALLFASAAFPLPRNVPLTANIILTFPDERLLLIDG